MTIELDKRRPMADRNRNALSFGPFELSIGNRLLTNGTKVAPLGARAMDLLVVLMEQANQVGETPVRHSVRIDGCDGPCRAIAETGARAASLQISQRGV
jgi:hypothetical protein